MSPQAKTRLATVLWVALAVIAWNSVFDRVLIEAGRRYSRAAVTSLQAGRGYLRIDDWMRPAIPRAALLASVVGGTVALVGLAAVRFGTRRERSRASSGPARKM